MNRKGLQFLTIVFLTLIVVLPINKLKGQTKEKENAFKIIGYLFPRSDTLDLDNIPYKYLTHINYSFSVPTKEADGKIEPLPYPELLSKLVKKAHENDVEVFLSVGGWELGDGGGDDSRFEKLADKKETRNTFINAVTDTLIKYNLDGADIDWEYPDPVEPSSSNFVKLMKGLRTKMDIHEKKLTAATISFQDRKGYGIKKEIFDIVDWLNIMTYDHNSSDNGRVGPHSPYWLGVRGLEYWSGRGLPENKSILGLPFYGKGDGIGASYKMLVEDLDADPYGDVQDSIFYNGIKTIKDKTRLAKKEGGGVMIWEIQGDVKGKYSLLKAIYETAYLEEDE